MQQDVGRSPVENRRQPQHERHCVEHQESTDQPVERNDFARRDARTAADRFVRDTLQDGRMRTTCL